MKLYLKEISEQGIDLAFSEETPWVQAAVTPLDERHTGDRIRPFEKTGRPIRLDLSFRNVDDVVVLNGNIDTQVQLICSRCGDYFAHRTDSSFSALYCKDPEMAGIAHLQKGKPSGQNHGWARHEHAEVNEDEEGAGNESTHSNLDITYLPEDFIELSDVVTEQLRLLIPFQPLCRDECKGACLRCGADLNQGRCACSKLPAADHPFAALKKIKIGH